MVAVQQHLSAFQQEAVSWAKGKEGALLACEMGTGKTRVSLATVAADPAALDPGAVTIIIAPLATLPQWQKEITLLFGPTAEVHLYRGEHRESQLRQWFQRNRQHSGYHFLLLNPDLWRMDVAPELREEEDEPVSPLAAQEYLYAILDEAHHYRNPDSLVHQTVYYFLNAARRLLLTGTPFFNSPKDLSALARVMSVAPFHQKGWWNGSTLTDRESWRTQYCYQVLKDDVLQLPRLETHMHHLELSTPQRRHYQKISKTRFECHLVKLLRQRQATCLDAPGHHGQLHHNARATAIVDIIRKVHDVNPDEKVIVFSVFREFLDLVATYLQQHRAIAALHYNGSLNTVQRQAATDAFAQTNGAVLLVSLTAGGAGLNLQTANHAIIAEPYWNYATIGQAMDRIYRLGQQKPCHLHYLVTDTPTDLLIVQKEQHKVEQFRAYLPGLTQVTRVDLPQAVLTLKETPLVEVENPPPKQVAPK